MTTPAENRPTDEALQPDGDRTQCQCENCDDTCQDCTCENCTCPTCDHSA